MNGPYSLSAAEMKEVDPSLFKGLRYRCIGPSRGGRVTAVAGIPSQPGTFYMGATGGGVWKTTDYGKSWANVTDGFFSTGSIGAIRVAPADHQTIYVGTGSDGMRSNVITGRGVYKSTDGGDTWSQLTQGLPTGLRGKSDLAVSTAYDCGSDQLPLQNA